MRANDYGRDRAVTINTHFSTRRLRENNYEKECGEYVCVGTIAYIQAHETNKFALARAGGNFQTLINPPAYDLTLGKTLIFFFTFLFSLLQILQTS